MIGWGLVEESWTFLVFEAANVEVGDREYKLTAIDILFCRKQMSGESFELS